MKTTACYIASFILFIFTTVVSVAQNVGVGTASPNTTFDVNGGLSFREGTALSLSTGTNNDVTLGSYSFYRITAPTGGVFTITGFAGGADGRVLILSNQTGQNMTIANQTGPTAANRIITGTGSDLTSLPSNSTVSFHYNNGLQRWLVTAVEASTNGTVTNVALSLPSSVFNLSGTPVTGSGSLTGTFANQNANIVFAGPMSGGAATPGFRGLVSGDIPSLAALYVKNQAGQQTGASFNVDGSGTVGTTFSTGTSLSVGTSETVGTNLTVTATTKTSSFAGKVRTASISGGTNGTPPATIVLDNTDYFVLLTNGGSATSGNPVVTVQMPDPAVVGAGHTIYIRATMDNHYSFSVASNSGSKIVDLGKANTNPSGTITIYTSTGSNGAQNGTMLISDGSLWYRQY